MHPHPFTRHLLAILIAALVYQALPGQPSAVLDDYIQQAFANNHTVREKQFQVERSLLALQEAKRMYLPEVTFGAAYTLAAGGRGIAIPIGDLLNPVYSTLNQLTQTDAFPQVENAEEQFLPNNFYDARFRVSQPLINAEIRYNRLIRDEQVAVQELDLQVFRRELVKDIKTAYFSYLQAAEAVRVLENARELLAENRRVNESLLRNDKIIPSVITRTDSELASVEANLAEARRRQLNAAAYFNHLLNRDLGAPITIDSTITLPSLDAETGLVKREEVDQLLKAQEINQLLVRLGESYRSPRVGLQLDAGSQNFDFEWGGYALLGLSVEIPLWNFNRNKLQVQQAVVNGYALQEQTRQVEEQIRLQILTARNRFDADQEVWQSYRTQVSGARRFYDDTFRRYREGVSNYIELLDARTQLTGVEIRQAIAYYAALISAAELERAAGAYPVR